jgi:hypothetical protein
MVSDAAESLDRLVESSRGEGPLPVDAFWLAKPGTRIEHGTPWFRMEWKRGEEPPRKVKISGEVPLGIAFGDIGLDASDCPEIAEAVRKITEAFVRDFPETGFVDE